MADEKPAPPTWAEEVSKFRAPGSDTTATAGEVMLAEAKVAEIVPVVVEEKPKAKPDEPAKVEAKTAETVEEETGTEAEAEDDPYGVKKRLARKDKQYARLERESIQTKADLAEATAKLAAIEAKLNAKPVTPEPDPDKFDNLPDYEKAKAKWDEEQKVAPKPVEAKVIPKMELPSGIDATDFEQSLAKITDEITPKQKAALSALPAFTPYMIMDVAELPEDDIAVVVDFLVGKAEELKVISKLSPHKQGVAFQNLVAEAKPETEEDTEDDVVKVRAHTRAPKPIDRTKPKPQVTQKYGAGDFKSFEEARNAEERARRGHIH